ncbi:MAG: Maf family nucleotide pyrophosphatase [Natronospirillum sp.]|uniref:Maf family protein n=1 Tax=Natronospirillum sp. TaxID=2812955 RepID=UPI0025EE12CC|nr:Maf family nucleotide pyrophosphatase [Natronospirillum sp.]MCH8551016.1 Maf family nucleotide pyrophosphatase [Natronospirillum sp.]
MQLVLASTSPYRKALLERLHLDFITARPDADETPLGGESPEELAGRLAALKAQSLQADYPDSLIIGSDQVSTLDDLTPVGKPGTEERAFEQLRAASGRIVLFYTGLCVLNTRTGDAENLVDRYEIQFRDLTDEEIRAYIRKEQPLDCAGSFKSEGLGSALFARHQGADPTSLIGLPLIALCECLRRQGLQIP